jgi:hypothetical protein
MAGNHDMDTYETCADIKMSQSVDLDNPVAAVSALSKVPSLLTRLTSARALVRFSIDTKNCPF